MEPHDRLLTIRDVVGLTRLSKPTIYKLIGSGAFPKQVHLAEHRVIWLDSEVRAWIASRSAQRRGASKAGQGI